MERATLEELMATRGLLLALMERLGQKKQNLGAVRKLEPFLSEEEAKGVLERGAEIGRLLLDERDGKQGGLYLPPGARA